MNPWAPPQQGGRVAWAPGAKPQPPRRARVLQAAATSSGNNSSLPKQQPGSAHGIASAQPVEQEAASRAVRKPTSRAALPAAEVERLAATTGEAESVSAPQSEPQEEQQGPGGFNIDPQLAGKLCLLVVAGLWGSYNPFLRLLYSQDGPPGPVAIMLFRGVLQSGVLLAAYAYFNRGSGQAGPSGSTDSAAAATADSEEDDNSSFVPAWVQRISTRVPYTAVAAAELGTWLFLATAIQTLGLQLTTATRAGFLIQATALLTPVLASFTGEKPSRNVWVGCAVALAGCLFIAADASATDADDVAAFSFGGDAAILSSAFFFSLATVRLGTYARRIKSVELAAAKSVVLGLAAFATFLIASGSMLAAGDPISDLWPGYTNPVAWGVMIYSALGPGALAAFLHAKGQSVVPPAEAQVIFSTVPLWSLAFAYLLLGGEPMSEKTLIGGAAVIAAGLIASRKDDDGTPAAPAALDSKSNKQA
ncbi:hypothetical protein D9Q98_007628 [Chlorella vulgaris]|uniref:EamA domain-containing protein n=1 Tax=Chlorella vulgaris TaxID=3077 RepID=A0A9D4TLP7_CHLVU|nr:hypothetical protein D9Q98_007628 [Chlorella vulgaris]